MLKTIVSALALSMVVGCSSAPQHNYTGQYCYTDQKIVKQNGEVSSTTQLECTDRPSRQAEIQRAGIDRNCEEFFYPERRHGKLVKVRGVRCEKFDGTWEIINIHGNVR